MTLLLEEVVLMVDAWHFVTKVGPRAHGTQGGRIEEGDLLTEVQRITFSITSR